MTHWAVGVVISGLGWRRLCYSEMQWLIKRKFVSEKKYKFIAREEWLVCSARYANASITKRHR